MGLMCSLLGHEYGEPETEREREERGDEVVEYVRTVEYCDRCGRERVVSESTEVRSVREAPASVTDEGSADVDVADDVAGDQDGLAAAFERVENEGETSGEPARVSEPAEFVDAAASAVAGTSTEDGSGSTTSEVADDAPEQTEAAGDDAELLSGGADEPETRAVADDDTDTGDAAEVAADEPQTDDAVILTDDGTERERERERGAWPSSDDTRETERTAARTENAADAEPESESARSGIASAGPIDAAPEQERGDLVCPECGKRTGAVGSSLRAGDICPDCHRGYLAEAPESA